MKEKLGCDGSSYNDLIWCSDRSHGKTLGEFEEKSGLLIYIKVNAFRISEQTCDIKKTRIGIGR
jgi:hypothetical protein